MNSQRCTWAPSESWGWTQALPFLAQQTFLWKTNSSLCTIIFLPSCCLAFMLTELCALLYLFVYLSFWDKVFLSKPGWTQSQDLAASLYQRWDCSTRDSPVLPLFEDLQLLPLTPLPLCRGFFPLWTLTWVLSCGSLSVFIFWLV